jgi:hypothetical protein
VQVLGPLVGGSPAGRGAYAIRALPDLCVGIVSERLESPLGVFSFGLAPASPPGLSLSLVSVSGPPVLPRGNVRPERAGGEKGSRGGLATVTGLLLRKAQAVRAGAQGDDDYDVIGTDGIVIGRIFKATTSPAGTPWMWTLAYGDHEDRTPTHGYEATREAAMQAFARSWDRET